MNKIKEIPVLLIVLFFQILFIEFTTAQTTIVKQSFETSGDTWIPMSFSVPPCTNGADTWDYHTSLSSISPSDGAQFWGIQDLNGNCGGSSFETITLSNADVSAYNSVVFKFDYNVIGFDNGDDLKYELFYDNVSQGEVVVVDGSSNFSTGGWVTESVNVPNTVTNVSIILYAKQNGGSDYGAFDNVFLEGISSCTPATISSVSPTSGAIGTSVTITASAGDLTGGAVLFNGVSATVTSSNATTIVCTVPSGATTGDLTITDAQPCNVSYSTFTVTCGPDAAPTTNANSFVFTNSECESYTIDWTNGDGANRIVVMSTNVITNLPTNQTNYASNSIFGSGSTIGAGEFVVYNGSGSSVDVTNLTVATTYYINVFEYNGTTINCDESYLTTSVLTGSQSTEMVCDVCPMIESILVNSCGPSGDEGLDEYIVFKNGSNPLSVNDIKITFPFAGSYCNTSCGTKTLITNATYISQLNTTAGCSKFAYLDPIPANSRVVVFMGGTPNFTYDFSSMCGSGTESVAILFCNNSSSSGRYANSSNANRTTVIDWGTCSQTATFYSSVANTGTDGDFANFDAMGNVTYSNQGMCLATPLPIEMAYFELEKQNNSTVITWKTLSELETERFNVLRSIDGINYETIGQVRAAGNSNEEIEYSYNDNYVKSGVVYYRLELVDILGVKIVGDSYVIRENKGIAIENTSSSWIVNVENVSKNSSISVYEISGALIRRVNLNNTQTVLNKSDYSKGIYVLKITTENNLYSAKVVK